MNLLGRFAQKITFCFDGDKAGQEAIKRSLAIVEKKGLTPTVVEIPGGKDPDEALQKAMSLDSMVIIKCFPSDLLLIIVILKRRENF